nr:MAG: putative RNA-dependent RNA polymerase [Sanya botourmia-like virus 17]
MDPGAFVSVDFEAATDNLSVNVAERILGVALSRAQHIPVSLRRYCLASLRPRIYYPNEDGEAEKPEEVELSMGQMMGSLLSFPLLCLQTFFYYLWCEGFTDLKPKELRSFNRCLVNGDDLVFKTEHPENFFNEAETTMSRINRKKTGISDSYFNINSTLFSISKKGIISHVPFLRPAQFDLDSPIDLGSKVREATRWLSKRSSLLSRSFEFLMREASTIAQRHGWSLWKCGFRGEKQFNWLKKRGLLRYEADVRSFGRELPAPSPPNDFKTDMVPVPSDLGYLSREDCLQITGVFSAVSRLTRPMPQGREKYSEKKELSAQRRDVKTMLKRLERPKKFFGICFDGRRFPQCAPYQGKSFPSFGTRFPLPVEDRIFFSRRSMTNYFGAQIKKTEKRDQRLLPEMIVSFLKSPFLSLPCRPVLFSRREDEEGVPQCQKKNYRRVEVHPIAAERVWNIVRVARLGRRLA